MQAAVSKKSGFKCPTFAAPPKKTDVQKDYSSDTRTENSKKDVKKPVPSPTGDNLQEAKNPDPHTSVTTENGKAIPAGDSQDVKKPVPFPTGDNLQEAKKPDPDTSVTTENEKAIPAGDSQLILITMPLQVDKTVEKKPKSSKFVAKRSNELTSQNKSDTETKKSKKRKIKKENNNQEKETSKVKGNLADSDDKPSDTAKAEGDEKIKKQNVKVNFANTYVKPQKTSKVEGVKKSSMKFEDISTTKVEKKTLKKNETLPVRSLTEDEYEELFTAVLDTAMSLDLDKWEPKVTSPIRVREPLKKKYGKTVGKKPQPQTKNITQCEEKEPEDKIEPCVSDNKMVGPESVKTANDQESESVYEEREKAISEDVAEADNEEHPEMDLQEANVAELHEAGRMNEVQMEHETTPAASEIDIDKAPGQASPPPKKKKVIKKNSKLEPKQLPFTSEEVRDKENNQQNNSDVKTATPMIDKIKKLKALEEEIRKEKQKKQLMKKKNSDSGCTETLMKKKNSDSGCTETSKKRKKETKTAGVGYTFKPKSTQSKKKEMVERDLDNDGTWVQCCTCKKWRHLKDVCDPVQIPEIWTCDMNSYEEYNSCDKEEEQYDESEHIYTKFTEGSVVWAKISGYPWWPALVEQDPDAETYFSVDFEQSMQPTHYHVVFFDERVSRTWVRSRDVKAYTGNEDTDGIFTVKMKKRGPQSYSKDINTAKRNANRALDCNLKTRIELFGFAAKYSGAWSKRTFKVQSPAKDMCKEKRKRKRKMAKHKATEDLLDPSAIENVIENADNILDNVEDLLESLDDQLDDSESDSDFIPEGLVVVEKKKQKKRGCEDEKENRGKPEVSSEAETESETSEIKKEQMKFDGDIFTMEMDKADSLSDSEVANESENMDEEPKDNTDLPESTKMKQKSMSNCKEVIEQTDVRHETTPKEISDDQPENNLKGDTEPVDVCDKTLNDLRPQKVTEISPELELNADHELSDSCNSDDDFDLCDEESDLVPGSQGNGSKACSQHSLNVEEESDNDFDFQETSMYDNNVVDELQKSQERAISPVHRVINTQGSSDPFDMIEE